MPDQLPNEKKAIVNPSTRFAERAGEQSGSEAGEAQPSPGMPPNRELEEQSVAREERRLILGLKRAQLRGENARALDYEAEANKKKQEAAILEAEARIAQADAVKREAENEILQAQVRDAGAEATKKEREAEILQAQADDIQAGARKKRGEAEILEARACRTQHAADKEPARQKLDLSAGWTRIGLTVFLTLASLVLLFIGYLENPLAFPSAVVTGLGLLPLKPWEFVFSSSNPPREEGPPQGGESENRQEEKGN